MKPLFVLVLILALAPVFSLRADAPLTSLRIVNSGGDSEGLQTFRLEWDAVSNATYLVQSADDIALGSPWHTLDAIQFLDTVGRYQVRVVTTDSTGRSSSPKFFRFLLPQPEISSVEPAVLAPGVVGDVYVAGQCFGSNDVLRINGVPQTDVVFLSSTLLSRPAFTPDVAGVYLFEIVVAGQVRSSFSVMSADAFADPQLVLQGPPEESPAAYARPVGRITFKAKEGATLARNLTGGDDIQENDNVVFDVQEGKKGLNAVNVKLARVSGNSTAGGIAGGAVAGIVIAA